MVELVLKSLYVVTLFVAMSVSWLLRNRLAFFCYSIFVSFVLLLLDGTVERRQEVVGRETRGRVGKCPHPELSLQCCPLNAAY